MTSDTAARMLRAALAPAVAVGVAATVCAALAAGPRGALGALLGAVLVVALFGLGLLVLRRAVGWGAGVAFVVAVGLYLAKVVGIGVALFAFDAAGALDGVLHRGALALTVIACTLAWTTGEIVGAMRAREPAFRVDLNDGR